jgi:hypothetical protein
MTVLTIAKDLSICFHVTMIDRILYNSKGSLITRIKKVRNLLNGKTPDGREIGHLYPSFKKARYCLVLLAAITHPGYEDNTEMFDNEKYMNRNQLQKVATSLGLEFDRGRGADEIYREKGEKGRVKRKRKISTLEHDSTFFTVTTTGEENLFEKLQDIEELNQDIDKNPMLQNRLVDESRN